MKELKDRLKLARANKISSNLITEKVMWDFLTAALYGRFFCAQKSQKIIQLKKIYLFKNQLHIKNLYQFGTNVFYIY